MDSDGWNIQNRIFSEYTGITIYKYLQSRRLTIAAEKLTETNEPITQIAYEAGYNSQQAFSHAFKQVCMYPPKVYRSIGIFLLAGGTHGKRMALPNAEIMIHQPAMYGNGIQGPASDIKIMSDYMQKSKQRLNRILSDNMGCTMEEIERDTDRDNFMSAEEALADGLIDSIISKR